MSELPLATLEHSAIGGVDFVWFTHLHRLKASTGCIFQASETVKFILPAN